MILSYKIQFFSVKITLSGVKSKMGQSKSSKLLGGCCRGWDVNIPLKHYTLGLWASTLFLYRLAPPPWAVLPLAMRLYHLLSVRLKFSSLPLCISYNEMDK